MKASEIISKLQKEIQKYGDLPVHVDGRSDGPSDEDEAIGIATCCLSGSKIQHIVISSIEEW